MTWGDCGNIVLAVDVSEYEECTVISSFPASFLFLFVGGVLLLRLVASRVLDVVVMVVGGVWAWEAVEGGGGASGWSRRTTKLCLIIILNLHKQKR